MTCRSGIRPRRTPETELSSVNPGVSKEFLARRSTRNLLPVVTDEPETTQEGGQRFRGRSRGC